MYDPFISIVLCCLTTTGFVLSLYILGFLSKIGHRYTSTVSLFHRDHSNTILYRIIGSILFTFVLLPCILLLFSSCSQGLTHKEFILTHYNLLWTYPSTLKHFGWIFFSLQIYFSEIVVLIHETKMFGQRYDIIESSNQDQDLHYMAQSIRNYFVSPILEEIIFRGIITRILIFGGLSDYWSAVFFGLAHSHHLIEDLILNGKLTIAMIVNTFVQFIYTCTFGLYCSFVLYKTNGQLWICVLIHMICNWFGLPDPFLARSLGFSSWPGKFYHTKTFIFIILYDIVITICHFAAILYFMWIIVNSVGFVVDGSFLSFS